MRTIEDRKRIAAFFEQKSKDRFKETGSYACEHYTDLRNSECPMCLGEFFRKQRVPGKKKVARKRKRMFGRA